MALNLGMLGYFKYYNFFAESVHEALAHLGVMIPEHHLDVALPIGISFYTFQSMSYVIDVYRRQIKPTRNLVQFALFVSFFPHLVAGPIMRPATLLPQVAARRRFDLTQFYEGSYLIFWGLLKKVVVADNLALVVNELFGRWQTLDGGLALLAVYAFAFQIYGDFSGYTDIARGIAKCLGFELPLNFNLPYFATSPQDFWNRWHISLSRWFRDYLYIPLGGSRGSHIADISQPHADDGPGRALARTRLDLRDLGCVSRAAPGPAPGRQPWLDRIRPSRPHRPWLLDGSSDRGHVPLSLPRLADLPRRVDRPGRRDAASAIVKRPAIPAAATCCRWSGDPAALDGRSSAISRTADLNVVARTPWYVRSAFYTGMFLRDRARRRIRRAAVHLF